MSAHGHLVAGAERVSESGQWTGSERACVRSVTEVKGGRDQRVWNPAG